MLHLEITEVVLVNCNVVNNNYQRDSTVLYTFVPNKPFGSLLEFPPTNFIRLKIFNSEFQVIEVCVSKMSFKKLENDNANNERKVPKKR